MSFEVASSRPARNPASRPAKKAPRVPASQVASRPASKPASQAQQAQRKPRKEEKRVETRRNDKKREEKRERERERETEREKRRDREAQTQTNFGACSTSLSGGNQVDGLPPAPSNTGTAPTGAHTEKDPDVIFDHVLWIFLAILLLLFDLSIFFR